MILVQSPPRIVNEPYSDEVLFQVATVENQQVKPFEIKCEAEGVPAPKYYKLYITYLIIFKLCTSELKIFVVGIDG